MQQELRGRYWKGVHHELMSVNSLTVGTRCHGYVSQTAFLFGELGAFQSRWRRLVTTWFGGSGRWHYRKRFVHRFVKVGNRFSRLLCIIVLIKTLLLGLKLSSIHHSPFQSIETAIYKLELKLLFLRNERPCKL